MKLRIIVSSIFTALALNLSAQEAKVFTLDEIFTLADSSRTVRSSEAAVEVADASVTAAKNALLPDIGFTASASYNGNPWIADRDFSNGQTVDGPDFGNNFALEVSQVIFAGGAISNNIKAAGLQAEIARLDLKSQKQKVRFLLTGWYLNLYKFRNLLTVYDRNIERVEQVIKDMKAKESAGVALSNDITRYEVQKQNLLYSRTELLSSIDIVNNQLVTVLDLPSGTQILPDTALLEVQPPVYAEAELQDMADANATALAIVAKNVELARARQNIVRSGLMPKIKVMAADNLRGPYTFDIPVKNINLNTWYVGIGLSFDIGNLYKTPRELVRSRASVTHAVRRHDEIQEKVGLDVHQAFTQYNNSFELLRTQEKSLQLAKENYAVVENRYRNDLVVITDLLDADNIRLDAETRYVNAQINIIYNHYHILYVTGTL